MKMINFNSLKSKRVRYGGYAAMLTFLAVLGLVVLNLLAGRLPFDMDLSREKVFSISDTTFSLLDSLDKPVSIYALYRRGKEDSDVLKVLDRYERSSSQISMEIIDPDLQPGFVARYSKDNSPVSAGTVIVESGDTFRVIPAIELYNVHFNDEGKGTPVGFAIEQKITTAIQYVTSGFTPKIYTLTGHGELSLDSYKIMEQAKNENYEVDELNILLESAIPEDANVLLIIQPRFDITEEELVIIHEWLQNGGRGIFLFDYLPEPLPVFNELLASYGLRVDEGFLVDPNKQNYVEMPVYLAPDLADHDILGPLKKNRLNVIAPFAVGVSQIGRKPRNVELFPLLVTSKDSFRRMDMTDNSIIIGEKDVPGPHTIAWAADTQKVMSSDPVVFRLIVAGNSRFLGPVQPYGILKGNMDFFLNALSWVNEREEMISIRSRSLMKMQMQINNLTMVIYAGIIVILIPLSILVTGLVVWLKRRHL